MLQRLYLAPKWHPNWTSARCRHAAYQHTLISTRRISTSLIPKTPSPIQTSNNCLHPSSRLGNNEKSDVKFQCLSRDIYSITKDLQGVTSSPKVRKLIASSRRLSSLFANPIQLRNFMDTLAKSPTPGQLLQTLELAHGFGRTPSRKVYESACFGLWASKRWDQILSVISLAQRHLGYTDMKMLNWRATALMESGQYALLQQIPEEFKAAGISLNQDTYHLLITGCIRNYDLEGSKRCLRDMRESGFSPNASTHVIISKSYWQFGADSEVRQSAIESLPDMQMRERMMVINNLLQFSLAQHDLKTVHQLLAMFDPPSIHQLLSLLPSHPGHHNSALPRTSDTRPDADTYAIFMNYQSKTQKPETAIHLWTTAATSGLSATPNVVAALIHAYFLRGHGDTAIRMVAEISLRPNTKEFQSLLMDPLVDPTLLEAPASLNLPRGALNIRVCNVLMKAILKRQGLDSVPAMFAIMHTNCLQPNDRTLELLLSHLNHTQEPRPRTLFQLAHKLAYSNQPSSRHMHNIISCILRDEKRFFIDSAWKKPSKGSHPVKDRRRRVRLLDNAEDFDPFAGLAFKRHLSYDKMARPILQSLCERYVKMDPAMGFLRMRRDAMLGLDVESALDVFRSMLARGLRPTAHHLCALIEGYALSGDFAAVNKVMAVAKEVNITPNIVMYTTLIAAHAKHRDPRSSMQVFNDMVAAGIRPDVPSIDALISAFYAVNDLRTARQLLVNLWPLIQPFPQELQNADLKTLSARFRTLHPYQSRGIPFKKPQRIAVYGQIKRVVRAHQQFFRSTPSE